mgnify:CR=1 FL=1
MRLYKHNLNIREVIILRKFWMILTLLFALIMVTNINVMAEEREKIDVYYFGTNSCSSCMKVKNHLDDFSKTNRFKFKNEHFSGFEIHFYEVSTTEGYNVHLSYATYFNLSDEVKTKVPAIFIGDTYLIGEEDIIKNFEKVMLDYFYSPEKYTKHEVPILSDKEVGEKEEERFNNFTLFGVFTAGFLDGFNPCAVAMLLFFISLLTSLNKKNKEILIVGISYILGTFVCYFLIGLGLFRFSYIFSNAKTVLVIMYSITIYLSLLVAIQNFREFLSIKRGDYSNVKLQLPKKIKHTIHNYIRSKTLSKTLYITAFGIGMVVSVLEFACTGQVYLPTIMYILSSGSSFVTAFGYLFAYNIAFIIPLTAICLIVYSGKEAMDVSQKFVSKIHYVKLATSIFFFAIAALIAYQFFVIL